MTDNIGEQMTDEEILAAQPKRDFPFDLTDRVVRMETRRVVVPNWVAADGRWADIYNALMKAQEGKMASATEQIVKAMERAYELGLEEGRKLEATDARIQAAKREAFRQHPVNQKARLEGFRTGTLPSDALGYKTPRDF